MGIGYLSTETESSESGSVEECTPTSEAGTVDADGTQVISSKAWKKDFFDRLGDIKTFGDFACMTRYSRHINPGLEVAGSLVPLPLVTRDADAIKAQCEQAPFGRGDDTVVDESVRKTWQLDASLFRCSNPAWPAFLDTVLQEAVLKLGMPKGTRAVPWKLLLYEEGSFFRPHKDSEKAPGMIGTLVLSLPAKHEGGKVHLSHSNRRHVFATSDFSSFDLTALAWYSDVTHEIKPISSGYRLVITYNLLQQHGSPPSAGRFIEQQAELQELLQKWASALQSETRVIYRLGHKYSQSSLSIQNMKGRDAQLIRCLDQACQATGFYIFLAIMTKTEGGEDDDYYGGNDEDSLQLDHVTALDGSYIAGSVDVETSEILGPDPYKGRAADSEDEGEFTGNESMPSQYRYHDSALMIVPRTGLVDLAKSPQCSAANLFRMVFDSTTASPGAPPTRLEALSLFESLLENFGSSIREGGLLGMVFRASKLWSSQALYTKAIRRALLEAQPRIRSSLSYHSLTANPTRCPTAEISEAVARFANEFFLHPTDQDWKECLGDLVQSLDNLTSLNTALEDVYKQLETEQLKQSFRRWRSSVEMNKFFDKDTFTILDLSLILSLIQSKSRDKPRDCLIILQTLGFNADKQLLYALINSLCAENGNVALESMKPIVRNLLDASMPKLHLEVGDLESQAQRTPQGSIYHRGASNTTDRTVSNVTGFGILLENCFMCGLEEYGMSLLRYSHQSLSKAISRLPPKHPEGNKTAIPQPYGIPPTTRRAPAEEFLASLATILQMQSFQDPPPFVRDLFILLFTRYILPDQPRNPPQRPLGWSHKPRFCYAHNPSRDKIHGTCHQCGLIQDFIRAPDQAQGRFSYSQKIRSHLEMVLPREHYKCTTDTTRGPGGSYTLVVKKISKDTEFREDTREFADEVRRYEQRLLPFRQLVVERLLGSDIYKSLITLESAPPDVSTAPAPTKRAAGESADQPPSTRQRTADVIDLTEE